MMNAAEITRALVALEKLADAHAKLAAEAERANDIAKRANIIAERGNPRRSY